MAIRTQTYMQRIRGSEGESDRLFRQVGFQVESEKTNGIILANMHLMEKLLKAGKLKDLEGNVNTKDAVMTVYLRVQDVDAQSSSDSLEGLELRDADGNVIDLDGLDEESEAEEAPFNV